MKNINIMAISLFILSIIFIRLLFSEEPKEPIKKISTPISRFNDRKMELDKYNDWLYNLIIDKRKDENQLIILADMLEKCRSALPLNIEIKDYGLSK